MPLLDGLRDAEAVNGSGHNGLQPVQPVDGLYPVQPIDAILDTGVHSNGLNKRQKIVVVGLGMVAISFIEKIVKQDAERRNYDIVVIGEESHVAYNRVGLSSFFEHRKIEDLYLNPKEWYGSFKDRSFDYHLNTRVTDIYPEHKTVRTSTGDTINYDILVLATGSDAVLPTHTPGHDAKGIFVYRTISDLERLIEFASMHKGETGVTVGGGLLGLEAAKAMTDLQDFGNVKLIDRNKWVLARQLDGDAGTLVTRKIRELGLDVLHEKRVAKINTDDDNNVTGIVFEDGDEISCSCICFAIGVRPRDELGNAAGIQQAKRGGFVINESLQTSIPDIYAIGECASWENQTFGIIAPGIEMADVLSFNLTNSDKKPKSFKRPDLSTKLKLLGVDVASFGDFFADRDGPKFLPGQRPPTTTGLSTAEEGERDSPVKALTYKDPFGGIYKKYLFTMDGKYLLGGMMIGDTKDYIKLNQMVKGQKQLEVPPSQFILGAQKDGDENADDLDDDTQICSCHNVSKGDVVSNVKNGTCKSIGEVKSCTKAGTGCGGCMPLVQSIFNKTMLDMGQEVSNNLCVHVPYSRADLYNIVAIKGLRTFGDIMKAVGKSPDSLGCELCKPAIASILASLFNGHVMDKEYHELQDTNDRFLANIQRNGTFSVVPRVPGGEITADKLITIGQVAKKFNLYCKITGAQRIDMFGAKKQDLLDIWTELVNAGMESGHAYAKSLRTIKSCVGTTWCRFGIGDSVGMAIRLEERYKSIRAPHKLKGAVSGCVRECAEAQNKDFGLISTEKGYNIFVGGNGGAKPRHSELLAKDVPPEQVTQIIDRYLIFYIRTADKLQRTARWIENLPGGINYLREVVVDDKLGIGAEMEQQMEELVSSYFCEWTETIRNPKRRKFFQQFANTDETLETVEVVQERDQQRPTYWPKDAAQSEDFKNHQWSSLSWQPMIKTDHFSDGPPAISSANVKRGDTQLAIFKVKGKYYATQQMCPHKRAFVLSDGLIGDDDAGKYWVSCPYHKRNFELNGEQAGRCSNDESMNIATFPIEERDDGWIYLKLPPVEELDSVLGTEKWKVKKGEATDPFQKFDKRYKGMRGKKAGEKAAQICNTTQPSHKTIDW
ncbi:NAD(P)H-nitrite reductase [Aspergillus steynii IBT 23096]|uniref:Nitrite reductase [NAD(P)H] n=1 Tax=Aspergillus steynii IBT 23096 TaxID=1392250 RepID=A0A2I2FSF8_9EURO|nr:NAD(P)H-nitrite reductase [Aspergillus steynii IBT 23096]PLB43575.1 NAD(P)H-nitrite reductase [Aspergillus steynii IBT 23096]